MIQGVKHPTWSYSETLGSYGEQLSFSLTLCKEGISEVRRYTTGYMENVTETKY